MRHPFSNQAKFVDAQTIAGLFQSLGMEMNSMDLINLHCKWTKAIPTNKDFAPADVDTDEETVTEASHEYETGLKVQVSNSGGGLPGGLSVTTDYYIIKVDVDTYAYASSRANALAGTKINLTSQGTGTHTTEVNGTLAGTIDIQGSNNNSDWIDILVGGSGVSQTITDASGEYAFNVPDAGFERYRVDCQVTSGQLSLNTMLQAK